MTPAELIEKIRNYNKTEFKPVTFAQVQDWTGYDIAASRAVIAKLKKQGSLIRDKFGYYGNVSRETKTRFTFKGLLDKVALTIALIIEIVIMSVSMYVIAPGPIERVGMIGIGLIVVCFALNAFLKPEKWNKALWAIFAFISFYINTSFALLVTDIQTIRVEGQVTIKDDILLQSLREQGEAYTLQLNNLNTQYESAKRGTTVDTLLAQIAETRGNVQKIHEKINERITELATGREQITATEIRAEISADGIFLAIPAAIRKGRIIQFFVFILIFAGLEISLVSSTWSTFKKTYFIPENPEDVKKKKKKKAKKPKPKKRYGLI